MTIELIMGRSGGASKPQPAVPARRFAAGVLAVVAAGSCWGGGAPTPDAGTSDHWAFRPVIRPAVPAGAEIGAVNPIDAFVRARLRLTGLEQSSEADRRTLIRRVYFDLLGLPPTPERVDAFAADELPQAYDRLVDEVLASPHFGERWARHWLDVMRFAESDGYETNQPRPNAWRYRDYVIRAFNDDLPYDQFVREQIAGDQLEADEATGFLVGGAVDRVKSPDPVLTAQQRADELHDIVGTTGSAFLGLTVNCARCHDHKFDPISAADYYAMVAVFAGVQHGEREVRDPVRRRREPEIEATRQALAAARSAADRHEPAATAPRRPPVNPRRNIEKIGRQQARFLRLTVTATNSGAEPCLDELEVFTPAGVNVARAESGVKISSSGNYAGDPQHQLAHLNDGRFGNSRSWISNEAGHGWIQLEWPAALVIDRLAWGRDAEGKFTDRLPISYQIDVAGQPGQWGIVASSGNREPWKAGQSPVADPLVKRLETRLRELEAPALAYAGVFSAPPPVHRLNRGDPMMPRELALPGGMQSIGLPWSLPAETPEAQRRMAMANWIASPDHPLTARVIVNRLWHHHFGTGLVETPSDFGRNGGRPSHPELLDWLATELVERRWRLKSIHRLILTSATYRQASAARADGLRVDAGGRWLWRFPPRRLEAEALRDSILAVSGALDPRMGGPGFDLFEPNTNYVKVYTTKTRFGPDDFRRMIYQHKPRVELDTLFGAFDCPDAGQAAPRRTSSITPLQALNLLNSDFILEQANLFAERLRRERGSGLPDQVRHAFRLAFSREPAEDEQKAGESLAGTHGLAVFTRALFNANEFVQIF